MPSIPLGTLRRHLDELPRDRNVVLYCGTGGRAEKAMEVLDAEGFKAPRLACRIAWTSIGFASAALLVAAVLGDAILDSYGIPVPVMALSGGLVLFLVAMRNLLEQFEAHPDAGRPDAAPPDLKVAMMPLAFPTIVTPYGIAAVVVLMALSPTAQARWVVGGIVVDHAGQPGDHDDGAEDPAGHGHRAADLGAVLGVVQVALGLQVINNALTTMGVL